MKKALSLAFLCFAAVIVNAQQGVLFKIKYIPNQLYQTETSSTMNMLMNFSGDTAKVNAVKASGVKLPMTMIGTSVMHMEVKSGAVKTGNVFPITFKYSDIKSKQVINDQEKDGPPNPMQGLTIYGGSTIDGQIHVDSISGKTLDEQLKTTITTAIGNLSKQVKFPETPLHVGETFIQETPINLPVGGINLKFVVKIIYKLQGISGNQASFDLDQTLTLDLSGQKDDVSLTASGSGKGSGKMVYDIAKNYPTSLNSDIDFTFKVLIQDLTMDCTAKISAINKTTIADLNK